MCQRQGKSSAGNILNINNCFGCVAFCLFSKLSVFHSSSLLAFKNIQAFALLKILDLYNLKGIYPGSQGRKQCCLGTLQLNYSKLQFSFFDKMANLSLLCNAKIHQYIQCTCCGVRSSQLNEQESHTCHCSVILSWWFIATVLIWFSKCLNFSNK